MCKANKNAPATRAESGGGIAHEMTGRRAVPAGPPLVGKLNIPRRIVKSGQTFCPLTRRTAAPAPGIAQDFRQVQLVIAVQRLRQLFGPAHQHPLAHLVQQAHDRDARFEVLPCLGQQPRPAVRRRAQPRRPVPVPRPDTLLEAAARHAGIAVESYIGAPHRVGVAVRDDPRSRQHATQVAALGVISGKTYDHGANLAVGAECR